MKIIEKYYKMFYVGIVICGMILYLLLSGGEKIWSDEAYTFALIKHNYSELWHITAADVHPPLYYILLKLCIQPFNYSMISAKIFSIIPYVLILIGGNQIKKIFDEKTSILFMGLFLIFPFSLVHAVEIRMYSLAAMFVFYNAIYAYKCYYEEKKFNWGLFVLTGVGAAYTHYFALVSVGIIYLLLGICLVIKKKYGEWISAIVCTIMLYLPWLSFFIKQLIYKVNNEYWIGEITLRTIIEYIKSIFGVEAVNLSALFVPITFLLALICLTINKRKEDIYIGICMLAVPIGTIFVGVVASLLVRPIFIIRYVVPSIPILVLFMAYAIGKIKNEIIITIILTVNIMVGLGHYTDFYNRENMMEENFLNAEFMEEYKECEAIIIATGNVGGTEHVSYVISYYENEKPVYVDSKITQWNPNENHIYIDKFEAKQYESVLLLVEKENKNYFYEDTYEKQYEGIVDENGHFLDVYVLTKR